MMPKSPAQAGRITKKKFSPFDTAGNGMFSNRSMSVQAYADQAQQIKMMN